MSAAAFHRPGQKTFGPWGNHTSSLDWCEDNYTHSTFVAEFWNTTSNILFIFLGIWGILSTRGLPNRSRYMLAHSFIAIIGIGSFIFHGTLLWHAQVMLDELPMLWGGAVFLYLTLIGDADRGSTKLKLLVTAVPAAVSWLYLRYPNPVVHQVAYGCIQAVSISQLVGIFKNLPIRTVEQARKREECRHNFITGTVTFLLGFVLWNLDNIFCDQLTAFRSRHGEVIGAFSQGHAWWHILTGLGASRLLVSLTYLTLTVRRPDDFEFAYLLGHSYVRRKGEVNPLQPKSLKAS